MRVLPNYCPSFQREAHKVWRNMSEAEGFGLPRNEETTTEELLLSLARKHKGRGLEIKAYSKPVESTNGADWAFWFTDGTLKGIGARIQAKRLYADEGRYKSLFHQSDSQQKASATSGLLTPNQCETLLNHKDGLVPLYVFYNSNALKLPKPMRPYSPTGSLRDWGISAASALAVKNANWGKNNRPGDFPMIPWQCLVCSCCWDYRTADASLPALVGHGLRQLYSYGVADRVDALAAFRDLGFSFEPTDNAPVWVGLLREGGGEHASLDEAMSRLNLKGVAILQETEGE